MKHYIHTSALMGLVMMLAGAVVVACQKDPLADVNPNAQNLSEAGFSLKGTEKRSEGTYVLPWTISKGGAVDSELEELDELAITPFNTFTFDAVPDNASGFPGINAKTDNACIKLERKNQNSFSISYVSDGDATITVWNGIQSGQTTITFKVQARKTIPVEGLLVLIDGEEEVLMKAVPLGTTNMEKKIFYTVPYLSDDKVEYNPSNATTLEQMYSGYDREDLNLHKVEFLHLVPENTTFRRLNQSYIGGGCSYIVSKMFCAGEYNWFDNEIRSAAFNEYNLKNGTDINILYGKSFFFGSRPGINPDHVMDYYAPSGCFNLCEHTISGSLSESNISEIYRLANAVRVGPKD